MSIISRRDALVGAGAAVAVAGVPIAVAAKAAPARPGGACDDLLLALGKRWREAYENFEAAPREGESVEETKAMEKHVDDLGEIAWDLEAEIAKVPAFSIEGVLIKLRIVGRDRQLMDRNNSGEWGDTYAQLTCRYPEETPSWARARPLPWPACRLWR